MERLQIRFILAAVVLFSLMTAATINAAPVKFNQVVQVVNAKPGKATNGGFAQLRLGGDIIVFSDNDGDDDKKKKQTSPPIQQDGRIITETTVEIVEEEFCDCEDIVVRERNFPYWTLGFAALPLLFLIPRNKRTPSPTPTIPTTETPTPTPPMSPTPTPTPPMSPTPTPTPPMSPTPTPTPPMSPTPTPTPTPPMSPTPTPTPPTMTPTPPTEPVPEPITILLFGTGLAGVGLAARKKFGRKKKEEESED